jgi:molecular chaperone DnaK (HSP70)
MLDARGFFTKIHATIQRALAAALIRGYPEDRIARVLMTGGCSCIPAVQHLLQQRFGPERVLFSRPLDAIAAGAASFAAGSEIYDRIQHEYAIRFWNSQRSRYEFRTIVRRGTPYPCRDDLVRLVIKATHDGQTHFGLPIFEIGQTGSGVNTDELELVTDPTGAFRLVERPADEKEQRHYVWMNEREPTFLVADPPAEKGASRFEVTFTVDGSKRLLVSSRDLRTGQQVRQNVPVVKLT